MKNKLFFLCVLFILMLENTVFAENKTIIVAHRGASDICPENTVFSFRAAKSLHSDGIETDLRLTKDNKIVLCHNNTIDSTSNGSGYIKDYTLEELKQFDFGQWKHEAFKGMTISTLEELLDNCSDFSVIDLELKSEGDRNAEYITAVADVLRDYDHKENIIISSFNCFNFTTI